MEPSDFGVRNRPHIAIDACRVTEKYVPPATPQSSKPLRSDYVAHAQVLLDQLHAALGALPLSNADDRLAVDGLKRGTIVELETLAPAEDSRAQLRKIPAVVEFPAQDIVVLRFSRSPDRTERGLLFVPDEARTFLRRKLTEYGKSGDKPSDLTRLEVIETIRSVAPENLFIGPVDFAVPRPSWWELWVRESGTRVASIAALARAAQLDVHANRLVFPDTTVLFVHASAAALRSFAARVPGAIGEIRQATGTIEPFLEPGVHGGLSPHEWVRELALRVSPPSEHAPVVCALDTGTNAAHPLLVPALVGKWAYDEAWGTDDHHPQGGHGTALASLIAYGDLEPLMSDSRPVDLSHGVESMKLLPPNGFASTQPPSYGLVTQGAVATVEAARPDLVRSFCLATSTVAFPPERPSSWSGALDQIAAGSMIGDVIQGHAAAQAPKRLLLVATGNVRGGMRAEIETCQDLEDPSQSWNALSIGGFTAKEQSPSPPPVLNPVVPANNVSPFSRGSSSLPSDVTPIKPELLFEAGNMVSDESGFCGWHPAVSLLAAGSDVPRNPLVPFWATSAAVGMAGNFIGRLQASLPKRWPETHRALAVDSAQWPEPIRRKLIGRGAHWKTGSKTDKQRILRNAGYGVPSLERAILSAQNDVSLIAEAQIQPFVMAPNAKTATFNEVHFYELPWPRSALEKLENETVTMKVTLSYFIEPNLNGKASTRPDTYRSYGLRFAVKKRSESRPSFRRRISASQESVISESVKEPDRWLLGSKAVQAGSLHCDIWRGRAIDLAGHDEIAVYPVGGWWKSHIGQRRANDKGRYTLVISICAQNHAIDLHAEIANLIRAKVDAISVQSG